ncbi:hypothetical protein ROBYS_23410 [Roseobacter sp. OBYS 0001]|nr:hypothetical protein ROBYS_23410 [Roseobacter sp. OBYS 0001]
MHVDIFQNHWGTNHFDHNTKFLTKLSDQRVAPGFTEFHPTAQWSDPIDSAIITANLAREQQTVTPDKSQSLDLYVLPWSPDVHS